MEPDLGQYGDEADIRMVRRSNVASCGLPRRRWGLRHSLVFILRRHRSVVERPQSGLAHLYCPTALVRHHHARRVGWDHRYFATTPNEIDFLSPLEMLPSRRCTRSGWRTPALCSSESRPTCEATFSLRMPSRPEPAHRHRVLGAILKRLPAALKSRRTDRTSVARTTITSTWTRKW